MASAGKYQWTRSDGTKGTAWRARWDGGGKRGFDRKSDALAYAQDREAEARHSVVLEPQVTLWTVRSWGQEWLDGLHLRQSSRTSYGHALRRVVAEFGDRDLASLRPSELRSWRGSLTDTYADSTARHTASILAMLLKAAVEDGHLDRNPMPPRKGGRARRVVDPDELLTVEQVRAWSAAMPPVARAMPLFAAMTGLRQGELLGLRQPNVDFLRREVRVVEQLVSPAGRGQPTWGPPKTKAGFRTVPVPAEAMEALAAHLAAFPPVDGEPLFRSTRGRRWRRSTFGDVWRQAKHDAGLPAWAHWHGLRDVYASALLRQGVDPHALITVMGHTDLAETKVYARLWADSRDRVRDRIADAFRPQDPPLMATTWPERPSHTL